MASEFISSGRASLRHMIMALASRLFPFVTILACALLTTAPLFVHGPSCGHDFDFHLQSWLAANGAWERAAGVLSYPHWVPAANYGAGEPRLVFYPPFSWTLGALLGRLLPWTWVPQAFTALTLAVCGMAFYRLAHSWVRDSLAAFAACLYLAGPYLLFVAYERAAYGELLGAAAMPLVVLYSLSHRPPVAKLALVIAALWLTNAPAAVMGCYLLALCALVTSLIARSLTPGIRAGAALLLGTSLAGVYVLPAWYEQRWVEITRVVDPGMRVEDSFLFGHTGEAFHDQVLHTASWLAIILLALASLCTCICWIVPRAYPLTEGAEHPARRRVLSLQAFLSVATALILFLLLPASQPIWRYAPQLRFLQFPWRWLLVGSLVASLACAAAFEALLARRPATRRLAGFDLPWKTISVALLCAGAWAAGQYAQRSFAQPCDEEDNVRAQLLLLVPDAEGEPIQPKLGEAPAGFEGTDEYTPAGADNGEVQQNLPAVRLLREAEDDEGDDATNPNPEWKATPGQPGTVHIIEWAPEEKRFTITVASPGYAVLRLMDYPAWQVSANKHLVIDRPHREDGLLTLPIAAGSTAVEIHYGSTPDVYAGRSLSLLSLSVLAAWTAWSERRRAR